MPTEDTNTEVLIRNSLKCTLCNQEIVSKHRHDYVTCQCGKCMVDGGTDYIRRSKTGYEEDTSFTVHPKAYPIKIVAYICDRPVSTMYIDIGAPVDAANHKFMYDAVLQEGCGPKQTQFAREIEAVVEHSQKESIWTLVTKIVNRMYFNLNS